MNLRWIAVIVLLLAASRPAAAQSLTLTQDDINYAGLEILNLDFDEFVYSSFPTLAVYLSFRYKVQPGLALVAQIPYAHYDSGSGFGGSESMLGDIYLGLEERAARDGAAFEFGVHLPTAPDDKFSALVVGVYSDVNRWESFLPKVVSVVAGGNYRHLDTNGIGVRIRLAPSLDIPTENGGDAELYGLYAAQFIYMGEQAEVTAGFSGRILVTETDLDFGERSLHQLDAAVSLAGQRVRPGINIRIPVDDDLRNFLDGVYGVQLAIVLD